MSYAQEQGYIPVSFDALMNQLRLGINTQFGTTYTPESFVGTNYYKYLYAPVQKMQEDEVKTSEVFQKLQEYIQLTNQMIQRPSVSMPGLVDSFAANDFIASVKPPASMDAGKVFICVDVDDAAPGYAAVKLQVCTLLKDFVAAGMVFTGTETENITISNGQQFQFAFHLPDRTPIILRLTAVISENNLLTVPSDEVIRQVIFDNINSRYRLGYNFEPQRYFTLSDALWAESLVLEWSDDVGDNWHDEVFDAAFDDLFTFDLEDIAVVVS